MGDTMDILMDMDTDMVIIWARAQLILLLETLAMPWPQDMPTMPLYIMLLERERLRPLLRLRLTPKLGMAVITVDIMDIHMDMAIDMAMVTTDMAIVTGGKDIEIKTLLRYILCSEVISMICKL